MAITVTKLRQNIYKILDDILEKGVPMEISRKGKILKIVPSKKINKLNRLEEHNCMNDDPESFVHIDWSGEWKNTL